eukprot:4436188-Prymnesium_polylepis.1
MSRTQQRFGLLWHGGPFEDALLPIGPLVDAWCLAQKEAFDGAIKRAAEVGGATRNPMPLSPFAMRMPMRMPMFAMFHHVPV